MGAHHELLAGVLVPVLGDACCSGEIIMSKKEEQKMEKNFIKKENITAMTTGNDTCPDNCNRHEHVSVESILELLSGPTTPEGLIIATDDDTEKIYIDPETQAYAREQLVLLRKRQ